MFPPMPDSDAAFNKLDNVLRQEAGCSGELDYTEQTSWLLFLKYLDDLEHERAQEAELRGEAHEPVIGRPGFRWSSWASPRDADGNRITEHELVGDDLVEFVDDELFPYLAGLGRHAAGGRGAGADTLAAKVGEVFGEVRNKFRSGYALRDAADAIDSLRFRSRDDKHELSQIYEEKIKRMGNAGRNGGEYYTPRPLIRAIVEVVKPRLGETVMDPACGSAGFLCEGLDYIRRTEQDLSPQGLRTLEERTFYGKEKKSLAYVIGLMNLILHGVDAPNLFHTNTLAENLTEVTAKDRHDVVLANPPFGGKERAEVQHNFPVRTAETAYLFLQHIVRILKPGGRAGVVIKNTFLSNADSASKDLRRELLQTCNLHTVLDCPGGTFQGAGVKTVVLFFAKGRPTEKTWYYQLDPGRSLGKTQPLNDADLADFVEKQATFAESEKSWTVAADTLDPATHDLSVRNPNTPEAAPLRDPLEILDEIERLDADSAELLQQVRGML